MMTRAKWILGPLAGAALLGLTAVPARAQVNGNVYDPAAAARQQAANVGLFGRANAPAPTAPGIPAGLPGLGGMLLNNPVAPAAPVIASPGLPAPGPWWDPWGWNAAANAANAAGNFMMGTASVISAEGRFRMDNQMSRVYREQARSLQLDNQRKALDEWFYERREVARWREEERERTASANLRYHLTQPAPTEIFSAASLNTILDTLKLMHARGVRATRDVPIAPEILKQINVTAGTGGNAGLLKKDGQLNWPLGLTGEEFTRTRTDLERDIPLAVQEMKDRRQVDTGRLKDIQAELDRLGDQLGRNIGKLTPTEYVEAKRYVTMLADAVRVLQQPDGSNYFTGQYVARGDTVRDLVDNMSGLVFAPAAPGEEVAYRQLHQAMSTYYNSLPQQAASPAGTGAARP